MSGNRSKAGPLPTLATRAQCTYAHKPLTTRQTTAYPVDRPLAAGLGCYLEVVAHLLPSAAAASQKAGVATAEGCFWVWRLEEGQN